MILLNLNEVNDLRDNNTKGQWRTSIKNFVDLMNNIISIGFKFLN